MARLNTLSFIPPTLIAATFLVATCAVRSARAAEPPADLCSLLPAADLSKGLGRTYGFAAKEPSSATLREHRDGNGLQISTPRRHSGRVVVSSVRGSVGVGLGGLVQQIK